MSCHGAGRWAADGEVFGVLEEALAGGILAEAVGEAGHGVEPAPVDGEGAHPVERRGLPVDGAGGGPGGAPGELILADLVGGEPGGPRGAAEEGGEMGDPAAGGAVGPELPYLVVLEVGVAEISQGRPLGAERARRRCRRAGGHRGWRSSRSRAGAWAGSLLGGGRGQTASFHIRSGGRHSQGDGAGATGTRGDRGLTTPSIGRRSVGEADVRVSSTEAWPGVTVILGPHIRGSPRRRAAGNRPVTVAGVRDLSPPVGWTPGLSRVSPLAPRVGTTR